MTPFRALRFITRFVAATLLLATTSFAAEPSKPNIVLILADDFGYECVGANGSTSYRTPHLDKLAAGGVRFEHCYAQPLCTPTRVQLMTGLYNVRNYTRFGHLDPKQTTFAHILKKAGYATAIVGKWQLDGGLEAPKQFGFDDYCLWQLTRRPPRYANPGLEINGRTVDFNNGEYGPDVVNQHAIDFIARQKDRPFLLYYSMMLTHGPFQPTPDSRAWDPKAIGEKVNNRPEHFADMVAYADKLVGRVVDALEKHGMRERTLILFLGDNGTGRQITSKLGERVIHGGKGASTAAGTHVPLIVNWPGAVPAGRVSRDLVDTTDFLPTLCEAAGATLPPELKPDGRSFLPQFRGERGNPRDWIYSWYARDGGAVAQREFAANRQFKLYRSGEFFDLSRDIDEKQPLGIEMLSADAKAARKLLEQALDQFRDARPAHLKTEAGARPTLQRRPATED